MERKREAKQLYDTGVIVHCVTRDVRVINLGPTYKGNAAGFIADTNQALPDSAKILIPLLCTRSNSPFVYQEIIRTPCTGYT